GKGDVLFYDLIRESFKTTAKRRPHDQNPVDHVAILPDGYHVVTVENKGRALLWDARSAEVQVVAQLAENQEGRRAIRLAAASQPGGAAFALVVGEAEDRFSVRLYDAAGKVVGTQSELPVVSALGLSDTGDRVAVGTRDGTIVELDREGKPIQPPRKLSDQ